MTDVTGDEDETRDESKTETLDLDPCVSSLLETAVASPS